ncbi:MAG: tRNA uridine-5-carboxymethylaminomethyl(34) synthesis GTPase MnmE [Bacteroidales bacterium]|nr:tRNA uridine-5-carboxymethylaminomethyl(34) synthesis GTPase MnmE [Bacteroidales bacterium]
MTSGFNDTIAAPATIPGTGAVAIVRVSGPEVFTIVDSVVRLRRGTVAESKGYTVHFGSVSGLDDVLVTVFRAPHSYTGEDSVEISIHSSEYIATELLQRLFRAGARAAEPGEFTRRAFLNGKMDLAQAEAVADIISSSAEASHRVAYAQLKGGFSRELSSLRDQLLEMASLLELELDFSEEDVEFASRERLKVLLDETISHIDRLSGSFRTGNAIKNGVPVAIAGAANTGKSTLLNALLGEERAIVSDIAGTTRDTIEETLTIGGILFRFVDTAGIRHTDETVERMGIDRTFEAISRAEIVLGVLDSSLGTDEILASARQLSEAAKKAGCRLIFVLNKADLGLNKNVIIENSIVSFVENKEDIILLSAKTGFGLDSLRNRLQSLIKARIGDPEATLVTNLRHYEALVDAASALRRARASLASSLPSDLVAEDLRSALTSLSAITTGGPITSTDILHTIFSRFCIGK